MLQFQWMDWRWIGEDGRYCYYNYTKPNQTKPSTTRHLSKLWLGWLHPSALQSMLLSIVRNRLGQHLLCLLLQIAISQYLSLYSHPFPSPLSASCIGPSLVSLSLLLLQPYIYIYGLGLSRSSHLSCWATQYNAFLFCSSHGDAHVGPDSDQHGHAKSLSHSLALVSII